MGYGHQYAMHASRSLTDCEYGSTGRGLGLREIPCICIPHRVHCGDRPQAPEDHMWSTVKTMCCARVERWVLRLQTSALCV